MAHDFAKLSAYRLILIDGSHAAERRRAMNALLEQIELDGTDAMDKETIIANEKPFGEWVASASTIPFFGDRRCVVIRNLLRVDTEKAAESLALTNLKTLPPSALLILIADDEPTSDERSSKTGVNSAWRKVVKDCGGQVLTFEAGKEKSVPAIRDLAQKFGKKMTPRAATLLLEMVAGKSDRAEEELQKLALYVGESPEINEDDLKKCVAPEPEYNVWHMMDAMLLGDPKRALHQYLLIKSQTRDFRGEAQRMIPLMTGYFRTVWQARGHVEKLAGSHPSEWEPLDKGFSKTADWQQDKNMRTARRLDFPKILACMEAVQETHSKMNGQLPGFSSEESMEQLILRICEICGTQARTA